MIERLTSDRIADRLVVARRRRFVGRAAELELFRTALEDARPPFTVLFVHGPGGVGKSTLLSAMADAAADAGVPALRLDLRGVEPSPPGAAAAPVVALSQQAFAGAVRRALRDLHRPDALAGNPLMRSRLIADRPERGGGPAVLVEAIEEAVNRIAADPRDAKLARALTRTYLRLAPTQEAAAEVLGLPFSTYRRHLTRGVERVVDWLWQRELYGPER